MGDREKTLKRIALGAAVGIVIFAVANATQLSPMGAGVAIIGAIASQISGLPIDAVIGAFLGSGSITNALSLTGPMAAVFGGIVGIDTGEKVVVAATVLGGGLIAQSRMK